MGRPEEIVTPHQTTLLKLVDSYLASTQRGPTASPAAEILKLHESLGHFLIKRFFSLSSYSQRCIARALGTQLTTTKKNSPSELVENASIQSEPLLSASSTSTVFPLPPPAEVDAKLPKVCEALVLITQCIVTISLEAEEQRMLFKEGRSSLTTFKNMKEYFNERKSSDQGIVENLIGLYCFFQRNILRWPCLIDSYLILLLNFFFG
jgi:ataxin-10